MKNTIENDKTKKFIGYPTDTLFGIIDDVNNAEQLLKALAAAGFTEETQVFHGEEGAEMIDASGTKHGFLAQLRRLHQKTTVEREHAERYERAVLDNRCVIAVHTSDPEAREQVRLILKEYGGHFINYYGRFGIRQLDR
jgi:hypothetical protein